MNRAVRFYTCRKELLIVQNLVQVLSCNQLSVKQIATLANMMHFITAIMIKNEMIKNVLRRMNQSILTILNVLILVNILKFSCLCILYKVTQWSEVEYTLLISPTYGSRNRG